MTNPQLIERVAKCPKTKSKRHIWIKKEFVNESGGWEEVEKCLACGIYDY